VAEIEKTQEEENQIAPRAGEQEALVRKWDKKTAQGKGCHFFVDLVEDGERQVLRVHAENRAPEVHAAPAALTSE
jgi:hypothetical protein